MKKNKETPPEQRHSFFVYAVIPALVVGILYLSATSSMKTAALPQKPVAPPAPAQPAPPTPSDKIFMTLKAQKFIKVGNAIVVNVKDKDWDKLMEHFKKDSGVQDVHFYDYPEEPKK